MPGQPKRRWSEVMPYAKERAALNKLQHEVDQFVADEWDQRLSDLEQAERDRRRRKR